eukprot:sb/3465370/
MDKFLKKRPCLESGQISTGSGETGQISTGSGETGQIPTGFSESVVDLEESSSPAIAVGKVPDVGVKSGTPKQPLGPFTPNSTTSKKKTQRFLPSWYKDYKWLAYDTDLQKAFCFACIHFNTGSGNADETFTVHGFNDWPQAKGKNRGLKGHAISKVHLDAMAKWELFKTNPVTIENRLDPHRPQVVMNNRKYFKALIQATQFLAGQGLAFRHMDESEESAKNRGNWKELLKLLFDTNPELVKLKDTVLDQHSIHVDYTSKRTFIAFVDIMADMVKDKIAAEVQVAGQFVIMLDECKDSADHEMLAVCVRYASPETQERLVNLLRMKEDFTAEALEKQVLPLVKKLVEGGAVFVGITTDGANVMCGCKKGLAKLLEKTYPHIVPIHCSAHRSVSSEYNWI